MTFYCTVQPPSTSIVCPVMLRAGGLIRNAVMPASSSKVMALETADTDITINTICPTYVKTPLVDQQIAAQARTRGIPEAQVVSEVMLKPMPKGVFIGFDELAGIAAFRNRRWSAR